MRFRLHRGSLDEAMKTMVEMESSVVPLLAHLNAWAEGSFEFKVEDLRLKYTGSDRRIGWAQSWYVYFEGFGVVGMASEAPRDAPETSYDAAVARNSSTILYRKHSANFQKSIDSIAEIPSTTEALLKKLGGSYGITICINDITFRKRRPDRRIGWDNVWLVYVEHIGVAAFLEGLPLDIPHRCIGVEVEKNLECEDLVKAECYSLPKVPTGLNAYQIDMVRSGVQLSAGWEAMFEMSKPILDELVLVNTHTGQRILIKLEAQAFKQD